MTSETDGVYLGVITVATYPDCSPRCTPGRSATCKLVALDPYDLVLTKLPRNADRDRRDVEYLATVVPFDVAVLRERYPRERRDHVGVPRREDLSSNLKIDIIQEVRQARRPKK